MKILIFGHVCIDQNQSENSEYVYWGSPAMFMHKIFEEISDNSITIATSYGHDYVKYLDGIDIHPPKPSHKKTLIYQNISKEGKRSQKALFREYSLPTTIDEKLKKVIKKADVLVFAPLLPNYDSSHIEDVIKNSGEGCLKVLLPQGYFRNFDEEDNVRFRDFTEAESVLKYFDLMTLSEDDYPNIEKLSEKWAKEHGVDIVVTKGKNGALLITKNEKTLIPTTPIPEEEIVDSVGSGDTFSAALIHCFQESKNLEEAILFAHKVAGEALRSTHAKY